MVRAELEGIELVNAERYWETINPYTVPAHHAHLLEGLRKAGLEV